MTVQYVMYSGFVDDIMFSHNWQIQMQAQSLRRSKLFSVTRQVALLNCAPGGKAESAISECLVLALQCLHCPKVFISHTFLDAHVAKRHCDVNNQSVSAVSAARPLTAVASVPVSQPAELDTIKRRLQQTEQRLLDEIDARNAVESKVDCFVSYSIIE